MKKKILLIGARGEIGQTLFSKLKTSYKVFPTSSKKNKNFLYLKLEEKTDKWPKLEKIDIIIFLGGITKILECERDKVGSKKINVYGLKKVIKMYKNSKTQIIFFSTTAVFNGKKRFYSINDKKEPLNEYAKQKLLSEQIVLKNNGLVIRVSKLVDTLKTLILNWKLRLKKNKAIFPFKNINLSLVTKESIMKVVKFSILNNTSGVIHLSSNDEISYEKIAKILRKKLKKNNTLVKPINVPDNMQNIVQKHSILKNNIFLKKILKFSNSKKIFTNYLSQNIKL